MKTGASEDAFSFENLLLSDPRNCENKTIKAAEANALPRRNDREDLMKKHIRILALLLACVFILTALSGCGGAGNEIKILLKEFEISCRNLDVRGMLACFNPSVSDPVLTLMTVFGIDDTTELLNKITPLLNNFGSLGVSAENFFSSITITAQKFDYSKNGTHCDVTAEISYGDQRTVKAIISCAETQGKWYIFGFDF